MLLWEFEAKCRGPQGPDRRPRNPDILAGVGPGFLRGGSLPLVSQSLLNDGKTTAVTVTAVMMTTTMTTIAASAVAAASDAITATTIRTYLPAWLLTCGPAYGLRDTFYPLFIANY